MKKKIIVLVLVFAILGLLYFVFTLEKGGFISNKKSELLNKEKTVSEFTNGGYMNGDIIVKDLNDETLLRVNQNSHLFVDSDSEIENREAFIAIHCEPGQFPATTDKPEEYYDDLVALVEKSDEYDIKLTLAFNPQWAQYFLANPIYLTEVRSWEANGHEIALHHHGPHHGAWNGYTDQEGYETEGKYIGTVEDMMDWLNQIPLGGQIYSAIVGGEGDELLDWPTGVVYAANGGALSGEDLMSPVLLEERNGQEVKAVRHAIYGTNSPVSISLMDIDVLHQTTDITEVMGLVWHANNYADLPTQIAIEELYEYLSTTNIEVKTLSDILSAR